MGETEVYRTHFNRLGKRTKREKFVGGEMRAVVHVQHGLMQSYSDFDN